MARTPSLVFVGVILWGLHMGATQGLLSTLVVDAAPADLRGTALGMYNLTTGIALLRRAFWLAGYGRPSVLPQPSWRGLLSSG